MHLNIYTRNAKVFQYKTVNVIYHIRTKKNKKTHDNLSAEKALTELHTL